MAKRERQAFFLRVGWKEKTIGWICDAAAYTGFPKELAELLRRHIPAGDTLCDLGCGVGLLDLELAPYVSHVTCVDQNEAALAALEVLCTQRGVGNLTARAADVDTLEGTWDTVLTTFFGGGERLVDFLALCRRQVVAVVQEGQNPSFGPCHPPKENTVERTVEALETLGVRYQLTRGALEYGQPLRSRGEAADFIRTYARGERTGVEDYLARALVETGEKEFPFYLPQRKSFGIFTLLWADNQPLSGREGAALWSTDRESTGVTA